MARTSTPALFPSHIQRWDIHPWLDLESLYCCMSMSYVLFLCSQVLPTPLWSCLLWTLTTQQKSLRLLFQAYSAQGNETASIILLNIVSGYAEELTVSFFVFLALSEHYLATVTWVTDERIAVQWLKRVQNHLILQIYNFSGSMWDHFEVKHDVMNNVFLH